MHKAYKSSRKGIEKIFKSPMQHDRFVVDLSLILIPSNKAYTKKEQKKNKNKFIAR